MTVPIRLTSSGYGRTNITAATRLGLTVANDPIEVVKVIVVVAGSTDSAIVDSAASTPTSSAANLVLPIPALTQAGTVFDLQYPCSAGLGVIPGTGATLAVVWQGGSSS